jgi:hypothetical protein
MCLVQMTCRNSTHSFSEEGVSSPKLFRDELEKSETPFRGVSVSKRTETGRKLLDRVKYSVDRYDVLHKNIYL